MSFLKQLFGNGKKEYNDGLSDEIEHINQEMYKKSAELNERNKTLSLLQKLDAIILGSITRLNEIAQLVTSLLVNDANFESVTIFLFNKEEKTLQRLAFSETPKSLQINYFTAIPLSQIDNVIVQAVNDQTRKYVHSPANILLAQEEFAKPDVQQSLNHIKSVHIFPLIVRNEMLGVLVICIAEEEQALSEYKKDLLNRLTDTIGIAIDNSLLYNQVQAANERLKQLDKLKDEFVSVASHELRTPMTAIKSYLWMALAGKGGNISEKQKFYLERAYGSVDRLIRLVNDMLNVSRIDSGRITIRLGSVALDKLVQEVFDDVSPRATELGVLLKRTEVQNLPAVMADVDKIKEVLFNLIGNSLKFTPKGGTITVSFEQKGNMIETIVSDTGTGIDPNSIGKLFMKFSMIASSYIADRPIVGTGLGLYICKSIIELHGGKVWAQSQGLGKGTQFIFSLKIITPEDMQRIAQTPLDEKKPMIDIVHTEL